MIDAPQSQTHDEYQWQPQRLCKVGAIAFRPERYTKTTDPLHHDDIRLSAQCVECVVNGGKTNLPALLCRCQMRRNRILEGKGIHQFRRGSYRRSRAQQGDIFMAAIGVQSCGDRLHAYRRQTRLGETVKQSAADKRLAYAGIGSRDEICVHLQARIK